MQSQQHMEGYSSTLHVFIFIIMLPVTDVFTAIKVMEEKGLVLCFYHRLWRSMKWQPAHWGPVEAQTLWTEKIETFRVAVTVRFAFICVFVMQKLSCGKILRRNTHRTHSSDGVVGFADADQRFECPTGSLSTGHADIMLCYYQLTTEQRCAFHYRREETENCFYCRSWIMPWKLFRKNTQDWQGAWNRFITADSLRH